MALDQKKVNNGLDLTSLINTRASNCAARNCLISLKVKENLSCNDYGRSGTRFDEVANEIDVENFFLYTERYKSKS